MAAPLPSFETFLPLLSFFVVFVIVFAILWKTKLIGNKYADIFLSFVVSIIFVAATGPRNYILAIIPWFAVLIVGLFLLMALTGFVGKDLIPLNKGIGIAFIILLALIFIASAFFVFAPYIHPYLPGTSGIGGNPDVLRLTDWLYSPTVAGAILLIGVSAVVAWILVRGK